LPHRKNANTKFILNFSFCHLLFIKYKRNYRRKKEQDKHRNKTQADSRDLTQALSRRQKPEIRLAAMPKIVFKRRHNGLVALFFDILVTLSAIFGYSLRWFHRVCLGICPA